MNNGGRGRHGKHVIILLTWLKTHIDDQTPILIHENVKRFDFQVLVEELEPTGRKFIHFENLQPADCGMWGLHRNRRVDVALKTSRIAELTDIKGVHSSIVEALQKIPIELDEIVF